MSTKIKLIIDPNFESNLNKSTQDALAKTVDALKTDLQSSQVMPFDTGNLQNESTDIDLSGLSNLEASIVHSTPYARRLYYHPEYNFSHKENPHAKGLWFEDWLEGGSRNDWVKRAFASFLRRATK